MLPDGLNSFQLSINARDLVALTTIHSKGTEGNPGLDGHHLEILNQSTQSIWHSDWRREPTCSGLWVSVRHFPNCHCLDEPALRRRRQDPS